MSCQNALQESQLYTMVSLNDDDDSDGTSSASRAHTHTPTHAHKTLSKISVTKPTSIQLRHSDAVQAASRFNHLCLNKKSLIYSTVLSGNEGRKAQGAMQGKRKLSTALFPKLWTVIYLLLGGCWNKVTYTDTLNSSFYAINY